jgi:hypothetical protein
LSAAAAAASGKTCTTGTLPELWAHAAHAYEFCAAAGLGDTIEYLTCVGIQSNASYNTSVYDEAAHYGGIIYSECTNMACKRAQPGCVSNASEGKICWGTVVELDPTYPTPAAAKAYIGYPCLETEPSLVPEVRLQHSLQSALPPEQRALYAEGTWQTCNCTAPAGIDVQVDAAIRNTARELYWTSKCARGNITALAEPVRQRWCATGSTYGAWQRANPLNRGAPTAKQLQICLQIQKMLRVFLTSPQYVNSPVKEFADAWRSLRDKVDDALEWCNIGQAATGAGVSALGIGTVHEL